MWILPRTRALTSISLNRFLSKYSYYSTFVAEDEAAPKKETSVDSNLMVDYLVNSIGFSREEAITASTKVSHLKSTRNPDSVINFFKIYGGLDQSQIKDVVVSAPRLLTHKPDKTLEAKLRVLKEFGFYGCNLVKFIKRRPHLFNRDLGTNFIPTLSYLTEFLGGDNCERDLFLALDRVPWLTCSDLHNLQPNLSLLKDFGFSKDDVRRIFIKIPRTFVQKPESLENVMEMVDKKLGIPRESKMFIHGLSAMMNISDVMFEKKIIVFRSFGWSDSHIFTLFRALPRCAVLSEVKIRNALSFFMNEVGYAPAYLATLPAFFTYSLEKRVKPRYEVLKKLKEHKLVKRDKPLYSLSVIPEVKFLMKYVLPYRDNIPGLYETYTTSVKRLLKA